MGLASQAPAQKHEKPVSTEPTAPRHRREKQRRFVLISYEHGKGMGCQQSQCVAYAITPPRSFLAAFINAGSTTPATFSAFCHSFSFLTLQLPPSSKQCTCVAGTGE